jgi:F420-non-reducing hydrogenase iron-sulfur subunit
LETVGIDSERLHFYNLSAAMGPKWAEICTEFSEKITKLGPSPIYTALRKQAEKEK